MKTSRINEGKLWFTVDSALLRELGERLVGKAHIALAELVKNAYDADATRCEITFRDDEIEIVDNGHGMTLQEFEHFWMRVGTTHKADEQFSRELKRPLTGSKGVGRLAVQFLASKVLIESTAKGHNETLSVEVDWDDAVHHEYITEATAGFAVFAETRVYTEGCKHGFRIVLSGLQQYWDDKSLKGLAQEVWALQAPFDGFAGKTSQDKSHDFKIGIESDIDLELSQFDEQVDAAIEQWIAIIEGVIEKGREKNLQRITVTFRDGKVFTDMFPVDINSDCQIDSATWEIRVFNLSGHFGSRIRVQDARRYFSEYGGVHVYDGPFRLPYYGIQQDWLGIEFDHSHRKVRSALLPPHFHVERALNDLPTQGRILGVVRVDTGREQRKAPQTALRRGEFLKIQVTRDRLQINKSYEQLKNAVRMSVDLYAVHSMRLGLEEARRLRPMQTPMEQAHSLKELLEVYKAEIPDRIYGEVASAITVFTESAEKEQVYTDSITGLLGPLATAGMSALALEHETKRQLAVLEQVARQMRSPNFDPHTTADRISKWISEFRAMRRVFEPLSNQEDRETVKSLRVERVIKIVVESLDHFLHGVELTLDIPSGLRLPAATLVEWQGIFQNVLTNALNAILAHGARQTKIHIAAGVRSKNKAWLHISDTGSGISISDSEGLFEPFRRSGEIPEQRRAMGLGGHGLGLTIVKMIAENRDCKVRFVTPDNGFNTTFELEWKV